LSFDTSPIEGEPFDGFVRSATGKVVVEFDVLTPHPRTEQLQLAVVGGGYTTHVVSAFGGSVQNPSDDAILSVKVTASTMSACAVGELGEVIVWREPVPLSARVEIDLRECGIRLGYVASLARISRVHVSFAGRCLRTTQAVGQPSCGTSPAPVYSVMLLTNVASPGNIFVGLVSL